MSRSTTKQPLRKMTMREQLDGFPFGQILIVALVRFAEPIAFTSVFPYLFFMVKDFGIAKSEGEIAQYAGYITGSFAMCQVISGIHWGRMSDKYGRKPIILISMIGSILGMIMLGFSTNIYMAIAARSVTGLLNGNVGVLRTMLGEIATERKHQALAFTVMPLLWQIGCVIGPTLGGYLANPVENLPQWFGDSIFFKKYPYALPNLVVSGIIVLSLIFAFFFIEETLESVKDERDYGCEIGDKIRRFFGLTVPVRNYKKYKMAYSNLDSNATTALLSKHSKNASTGVSERQFQCEETSYGAISSSSSSSDLDDEEQQLIRIEKEEYKENWGEILTPKVNHMILQSALLSLCCTVFEQLLPVVLSTSIAYLNPDDPNGSSLKSRFPFYLVGGMGFSSVEVGFILSCNGVVGILTMLTITPWVDREYGTLIPFRMVLLQFPFLYFIMPYIILAGNKPHDVQYFYIFIIVFWKTMLNAMAFPELSCLTNRSASKKFLGTVNGVVQVASAFARSVGPIFWGFIMAYSQKHNCVEITWWTLAIVSVYGYIRSWGIVDNEDEEVPQLTVDDEQRSASLTTNEETQA